MIVEFFFIYTLMFRKLIRNSSRSTDEEQVGISLLLVSKAIYVVIGSIRLWDNRSSNLLRQNNMKHIYLFYGISDSKKNEPINLEKVTLRFQCLLVSCL